MDDKRLEELANEITNATGFKDWNERQPIILAAFKLLRSEVEEEKRRNFESEIKKWKHAAGADRECNNCSGGLHAICSGPLHCNCGCRYSLEHDFVPAEQAG